MTDDNTSGADVNFLIATVKAIVEHPDDVIVERIVDDLGVLLKLRVNEADMSRIVGKSGQTAKALRTLLRLVGSKVDERVNLKILEPDGSERRVEKTFTRPAAPTPRPTTPATQPVETKVENAEATPTIPEENVEEKPAGASFENVI
jgi:hypothetical protein